MQRVSILAAALALALAAPKDATACGGFFRRRATKTVTVPSLQVEQVLILHDPVAQEEHFIRELVFRDAHEPFGFVVPTPSQPKVAKVAKSPFNALAARFPPEPPELRPAGIGVTGGGGGRGSGLGSLGAPPVQVLSQQRIGSFTVFVLAATDATALKKWLDDNELATTPESEAWLAHYVKIGFYFAAFRYEMPAGQGSSEAKSETVRISFPTPLPYYPYREPDHPSGAYARVLAVWFASPERFVPVAAGPNGWNRPWAEPMKHPGTTAEALRSTIGDELATLLPKGAKDLVVQTFEDQKRTRRGFTDVVLVPETPHELDAAKTTKLMGALDPEAR